MALTLECVYETLKCDHPQMKDTEQYVYFSLVVSPYFDIFFSFRSGPLWEKCKKGVGLFDL